MSSGKVVWVGLNKTNNITFQLGWTRLTHLSTATYNLSTTTSLVLPAQNCISHIPDSINQIHHTCSLHPVFKTHITPCLFARYSFSGVTSVKMDPDGSNEDIPTAVLTGALVALFAGVMATVWFWYQRSMNKSRLLIQTNDKEQDSLKLQANDVPKSSLRTSLRTPVNEEGASSEEEEKDSDGHIGS
ncbi:hypothetical protein UPYG_G00218510 [Umbra pygmaea]|uniref:Uncharacterized protein n=1 Tax=Umbra pygmaea TaxID=75934 RepID=A0ABD0WM63_UMBPY